ncbi:hypothetical protein FGF1_33060 [Flavobacteriaceae bacterium GF1]
MQPIFLTIILSTLSINAHNFNGVWLRLNSNFNELVLPKTNILIIQENEILSYEFDELEEEFKGSPKDFFESSGTEFNTRFIWYSNNHLLVKLKVENREDNDLQEVELFYVRLGPTVSINTIDIEKFKLNDYELTLNGIRNLLHFNSIYDVKDIPYLKKDFVLGKELRLETFKDILFLCFYLDGFRSTIIPISEINEDGFFVYGFSRKDEKAFAKKI